MTKMSRGRGSDIDVRICTTKVRTGCATCKRRRIKCDESSMPCRQCVKAHRVCEGYEGQRPIKLVLYSSDPAPAHDKHDRTPGTKQLSTTAYMDSALGKLIGGFRTDSFNALPIESTRDVQIAFDNLFHLQLELMDEETRREYVGIILNDAMFFECLIAYSKVTGRYARVPSDRLDSGIRVHTARVLQQLSVRVVESESQTWIATVLTVYYLLVVCQAADDRGAYRVHLKGLRELAGMQPVGVSSCFVGFIAARVRSAEVVNKFLMDGDGMESSCIGSDYGSETSDEGMCIPRPFCKLVSDGKISSRGLWFLRNVARYLGRPYAHSSKDRHVVLLALRMIESLGATSHPAHALRTQRRGAIGAESVLDS